TDATQAKNYTITNPTCTFSITTKSVAINWQGENGSSTDYTYTYNGLKQSPTAYFTDVNNKKVYFEVDGGQTNASGTAYTASVSTTETAKYSNYAFTGDKTKSYTINAMSVSVVWENTSFEYDNTAKAPTASYIDIAGTKVALELESSDNKNVGEYTAMVKAPTNTNYQVTQASKTVKYKIEKGTPKVTPDYDSETELKVGMSLPALSTTTGDTAGTISWVTNELALGTNKYVWVFVPNDMTNYNVRTGEIELTVSPADGAYVTGVAATFTQEKALVTTTDIKDIADFGTLKVEEVYSDNTRKTVTADYTLSVPEGGLKAGANVITVTYKVTVDDEEKTYTATFTVFAEDETPEATLDGISANFAQDKTLLTSAEFADLLDYGTLTVEEVYSDGAKKEVAAESYELTIDGGKFVEGLNTVKVTYKVTIDEKEETFETTFTVFAQATAKTVIVIVIDNKASVVGEELKELTYTILSGNAEFADGDIVLTKAEGTKVGEYAITGEYKGETYEVKFVDGTYTITTNPAAKQVTVVINNKTSEYGSELVSDLDYTVIGLEDGKTTLDGVTLTKAEGTDAGDYAITGEYTGSNLYSVEFVDGTYTITPKNITVAIENKTTKEGASIADLTYKVIGANKEDLDGTIKLSTNADAHTPNEYAITGSYDGKNYAITWVEGTYTVLTGVAEGTVIVLVDNKTSVYGEAIKELTYTVIDDTVTAEELAGDIEITKAAGTNAGEYKITAKYTGELSVKVIPGTYTITPKEVTAQISNSASYRGAELAALTSDAPAEVASGITLSTEATGLTVGEYAITGEYTGSGNYAVTFINGVYTVKEVTAGVTHVVIIIADQTSVVGDELNELTYTTVGLEAGEEMKDISITTNANKDEVNVYAITGKYTGTGNYVVVFVDGTYTVTAKALAEVTLSAKQTGEIFANTTVETLKSKIALTLSVDGKEEALEDYELTADLEKGTVTVAFEVDGEKYTETVSVYVTAKAIVSVRADYTQGSDRITPNTDKAEIPVKVYAEYNDGTEAEIAKADYKLGGVLTEGESTLIVTYEADGKTYTTTFAVTVSPLESGEVTESTIQWKNLEFVFDGNEHTPYAYYTVNGGTIEVALKVTIDGANAEDGKAIAAGIYTATVDETQAIVDGYKIVGEKFKDFEIEKAEVVINWTNKEANFDNQAHAPEYEITSTVQDGKVDYKVEIVPQAGYSVDANGNAVNAGKYTAKVTLIGGDNYKIVGDVEWEFEIGKGEVDKTPADDMETILGKEFSSLSAAIAYVKSLYKNREVEVSGEQTSDGKYEVTVRLQDAANYEWTDGTAEAQSFKFGATITPVTPENEESGVSNALIIALIAAMVVVAFIALIAFIIILKKPKASATADDGGFYEELNA
ncbi:MAG: hypothetical protein NC332_05275, partial [Firmicutes bacterium]|nr:hypothetical protein [Bacillota bacterium]